MTHARMWHVRLLTPVLLCFAAMAALAQDDIERHRSCVHCGMDRKAFGYSRMLITYADGAAVGICSLRCAAVELRAGTGRKVTSVLVADRDSRVLIEAERAVWVMGGKKPGVMTPRPKWAFQAETGANAFLKANGGKILSWAEVYAAAREELETKAR